MGNFFEDIKDGVSSVFSGGIGTLNSALGDPLGFDAQAGANAVNEARYREALALYEGFDPTTGFKRQQQSLFAALNATNTGYGKALGSLATMGARGRQAATDQGRQAQGRGTAALIGSGLGTSTRMQGLARGVAADTARGIQSVNEGVAGAQAGLQAQQGNRLAQIRSLLGTSQANQNTALGAWRQSKINTIGNRQDVAGSGWLAPVLGAASGIAGLVGGFGGGGAASPPRYNGPVF